MAVQESAAQLSMTLKVQEYPTLKVGLRGRPRLAGTGGAGAGAGRALDEGRGVGPGSPAVWGRALRSGGVGLPGAAGPASQGLRGLRAEARVAGSEGAGLSGGGAGPGPCVERRRPAAPVGAAEAGAPASGLQRGAQGEPRAEGPFAGGTEPQAQPWPLPAVTLGGRLAGRIPLRRPGPEKDLPDAPGNAPPEVKVTACPGPGGLGSAWLRVPSLVRPPPPRGRGQWAWQWARVAGCWGACPVVTTCWGAAGSES